MKSSIKIFSLITVLLLLASCSKSLSDGCPDAEIEWIDTLMINNIHYQYQFPEAIDEQVPLSIENGKKIGEVSYKMADKACSNHKMKNGDATYLTEGTPIYEVKGYPTDLMVAANNKVYIADRNEKAKAAKELLPLKNAVKNIHIESTEDGRRLHTFSQSSTTTFLKYWEQLGLEDATQLYEEYKMDGKRVFIEIELKNGVSFRLIYYFDENIFSNGVIGNKEVNHLLQSETNGIKDDFLFSI